jgi:hypothetical protein
LSTFISKALADAHKVLDSANKSNVSTRSGHPFGDAPVSTSAPAHEYSQAPYRLASQARQDAKDVGVGIKNRLETLKQLSE